MRARLADVIRGSRRVPTLLQTEQSDCGVACVAMIASYYGRNDSLRELRNAVGCRQRGQTLADLNTLAQQLGLQSRSLRIDVGDLSVIGTPAILHWQLNHFVVLTGTGRKGINIVDPAEGRMHVCWRDVRRSFTGVAMELRPTAEFVRTRRQSLSLWRLALSLRGLGRFLLTLLVLLLTAQVLALAPAVMVQLLIDNAVVGQDRRWLFGMLAGTAAFLFASIAIDAIRKRTSLYTGARLAAVTETSVVQHLYALPPDFAAHRLVADIASRMRSLAPLRTFITEQCVDLVTRLTVLLSTSAVMAFYSRSLLIVSLVGIALSTTVVVIFVPATRRLTREVLAHQAQQHSSLLETLRNAMAVRALGLRASRADHWQDHFFKALSSEVKLQRLQIGRDSTVAVVGAVEQTVFLGVGISAVLEQSISLGALFAFVSLRARFAAAAISALSLLQASLIIPVHRQRLEDIVLEPAPEPRLGGHEQSIRGQLSATALSYAYRDGDSIVSNFDCQIKQGEIAVIVGPSGCGKSTVLQLLAGLLARDAGQIQYDGIEIDLWNENCLRAQSASVLQNEVPFHGSILQNICAFDPQYDIVRARDAAIAAQLWSDIERMPLGMHTMLGDSHSGLSGGQQQRLLLARALYRRPRLLFLDEATSHLDESCEQRILDHLQSLRITVVTVAHRSGVIKRASKVIDLGA